MMIPTLGAVVIECSDAYMLINVSSPTLTPVPMALREILTFSVRREDRDSGVIEITQYFIWPVL
jgi:hypothetical protein